MFIPAPGNKTLTVLSVLVIMAPIIGFAVAQGPGEPVGASIIIDSRFKLWDPNEKMIDQDFTIWILYQNDSNNNTANLTIEIDFIKVHNETFQHITKWNTIIDRDHIEKLKITVNNQTVLEANNILIQLDITGESIGKPWKPNFLEILPTEWTAYQWNQFLGVCMSVLISIYVGYRAIKVVRKRQGGRQLA